MQSVYPMKKSIFLLPLLIYGANCIAQDETDSLVRVENNYITLSEIVVNRRLDVASFIERVKNDTTFYKAFRNLHIIGFSSLNDIRMLDRDGDIIASLYGKTIQHRNNSCRTMEVIEEKVSGDMFDRSRNFNYYTPEMYASMFFTKGSICGEDNIVKGREFSAAGLSGLAKHKEQLKKLFFNPGSRITGLPFISGKTEIFDPGMADKYDMNIDLRDFNHISCYVFTVKAKDDRKSSTVINEMVTWFNEKNFEIVARKYALSYDAGIYDFDVEMEAEMTKVGELLVPALLRYNGNWKAIFKKRERGIFTATLFDFKN